MALHSKLDEITDRIRKRSELQRANYVQRMGKARSASTQRARLSCGNLAHGFAASSTADKRSLRTETIPNIAIVTAYNDMLSAHQPFQRFPEIIKRAARQAGAVAQVAGGVPAMCDGVTQGRPGMELSLFSRDVIAMATAVSLTHNMFDAVLCLGVCDKIVPGLLMGALSFAHLPTLFVPAGPMPSGLPNMEKARIRQSYARGEIGREELLVAESKSYHSAGTCTFYGTANSNQLLMEMMGLHLPGSSFINPTDPMRDALTKSATQRVLALTESGQEPTPLYEIVDECAVVNGLVGLLASGGSTNHSIHLIAIARAAGITVNWDDFSELSAVVPLLCRIYPNGQADVNHFQAAGGIGFLVRELLGAGLLHEDVQTVAGKGLHHYTYEPYLKEGTVTWKEGTAESLDQEVLTRMDKPFRPNGGMTLLQGNLGRAVIKTSAVEAKHLRVHAPAMIFDSQSAFLAAFEAGQLDRDLVAVVRYQGPRANGMPELHKLTPALSIQQDKGYQVALVTDGRMSGASGKVAAAIHVSPEVLAGGPLGKLRQGDLVLLDAEQGVLTAQVEETEWAKRETPQVELRSNEWGLGRELFAPMRAAVCDAEEGATIFAFK